MLKSRLLSFTPQNRNFITEMMPAQHCQVSTRTSIHIKHDDGSRTEQEISRFCSFLEQARRNGFKVWTKLQKENKHPKLNTNFDMRRQLEHFQYVMNRTKDMDRPFGSIPPRLHERGAVLRAVYHVRERHFIST